MKKFFRALALSLILIFTSTAAYAGQTVINTVKADGMEKLSVKVAQGQFKLAKNKGLHGENGKKKGLKGNKKEKGSKDRDEAEDENRHPCRENPPTVKRPAVVPVTGIALSKTSTTLTVGSWEMLNASVQPVNATDKKYFWFSDNPAVVSVNPSGKITGLTPGTAKIYAVTRDGFKMASCLVSVEGSPVTRIPVNRVSLNYTSVVINSGTGIQLTSAITPSNAANKAVTWRSSNTAVATVNQNGYVFGVEDGTAVVTVSTADGDKTAACTVTVKRETSDIHVTSVSIIRSVSSIAIKQGATKHLDIEVLPDNARDKQVVWSTSNPNVVSVNQDGYIAGVNAGTASVTVTAVDGSQQDTCTVNVVPASAWVNVTGIKLNFIEITILKGFNQTLGYEIGPSNASDKDVRWSSSNSAVAPVNRNGRIQANAAGTAVITATTVDGSKTASCLVIVRDS